MRQTILSALLIASFGAVAATASAQGTAPENSPRNAPVGTSAAAPTDGTADPTSGANNAATYPTINAPAADSGMNAPAPINSDEPAVMGDYKSARAACDQQPITSRAACEDAVNANFTGVAPECQKVSGPALDACLKGADAGQ